MSKTVEDILKEEGVIKPLPQEDTGKVKFNDESIDLKKVVMSVEKLQTEVETLRDFKKQNDEVMRELTEKIGEIRSLFFQRESLIKETETKVKTLDDIVSDINPSKYLKELDKRKEEILESQARIEKSEMVEKELTNNVNSLKQTLQNIRSVENLEKLLKEIQDNVSKNRQLKDDIERTAGKTERFYFEMENRIKDFVDMKSKMDKIEDLSQELAKSVDSINIRIAGFLSKTDIDEFKRNVNSVISSNREYIESKVKEIEDILSLPSDEATARVEQLRKRRSEVSNLISNLDSQYKKALISESTYNEVKQKNEMMVKQIEDELNQIQSGQGFSLRNLPSIIRDIENKANSSSVNIEEQERRTDESLRSMESKLSAYVQESASKSGQIKDEIERLEGVSQALTKSVEDVNAKTVGFVSKSDIEEIKRNVNGIVSSNKDYVDAKLNEMKNVTDSLNTRFEGLVSKTDMQELKESIDGVVSSDRSYVDSEVKEVKGEADKIEGLSRELTESMEKVNSRFAELVSKNDIEEFKNNLSGEASSNRDYIDAKLNEFRENMSRIEGLSKDFKKSLENVNTKLDGFIPKTDIDNFKNSVKIEVSSNKDYVDGKMRELESAFNLSEGDVLARIEQLKKRRSDLYELISSIEDKYSKSLISESTYNEVKQKNEIVIKHVEDELNQIQKEQGLSLKTLPSAIKNLEEKAKALDDKIGEQEKHIEESLKSMDSDSKLANVSKVLKIQTDMLDDVIKKMKEMNDKVSAFSTGFSSYEMRIRFFEILDGLVRLDNSKDITYYLTELENLILRMKKSNLWDSRRESMSLSLLSEIAGNWRRYGYTETAKVFDDEIIRIKSPEGYQYLLK